MIPEQLWNLELALKETFLLHPTEIILQIDGTDQGVFLYYYFYFWPRKHRQEQKHFTSHPGWEPKERKTHLVSDTTKLAFLMKDFTEVLVDSRKLIMLLCSLILEGNLPFLHTFAQRIFLPVQLYLQHQGNVILWKAIRNCAGWKVSSITCYHNFIKIFSYHDQIPPLPGERKTWTHHEGKTTRSVSNLLQWAQECLWLIKSAPFLTL